MPSKQGLQPQVMPVQLRRDRIILAWRRNAFGEALRVGFLNCN
jgi:hypothetical protein